MRAAGVILPGNSVQPPFRRSTLALTISHPAHREVVTLHISPVLVLAHHESRSITHIKGHGSWLVCNIRGRNYINIPTAIPGFGKAAGVVVPAL